MFLFEQEVVVLSWGLVLEPSLDDQGPSHGLDRTVCMLLRLACAQALLYTTIAALWQSQTMGKKFQNGQMWP